MEVIIVDKQSFPLNFDFQTFFSFLAAENGVIEEIRNQWGSFLMYRYEILRGWETLYHSYSIWIK